MKNKTDAHLTKKAILIQRGIVKEDDAENLRHQEYSPRGFTLNLCGHCTYKCSYCPQSFKPHPEEYIKPEIVYKVFDELGDKPVYVQMGTRGENLLHPKFFDFIRYIKNKSSLSYICLNTNAYIIDDKMMEELLECGIDQIVFSLQTIRPELYKKITGSPHYQKIVDRIISFVNTWKRSGSKTLLSVQFLGFPENLPYRQEFIDFWSKHDIDMQFQMLHSWGDKFRDQKIDDSGRYPCPYLWLYPTVTHSGKLTTCFADFYDEMAYGSLEKESVASLWQSEKANALREKHLQGKWEDIPMCANCGGFKAINSGFEYHEGKFRIRLKKGEEYASK